MTEKIADIPVKTARYTKPAANSSSMAIMAEIYFNVQTVSKAAKSNIRERAELYFGTGKNLGICRLYLNTDTGIKLIKAASYSMSRHAICLSENSNFPLYDSHRKDYRSLDQHATLYRAGSRLYLEYTIMPASYDKAELEKAIATLKVDPSLEGWRKYDAPIRGPRRKKSITQKQRPTGATAPMSEQVNGNIWNTLNDIVPKTLTAEPVQEPVLARELPNSNLTLAEGYFVIKQGGNEEMWVKKASINIDCFKVIDGKPVINTPNGELALNSTVQDFLAAIEG